MIALGFDALLLLVVLFALVIFGGLGLTAAAMWALARLRRRGRHRPSSRWRRSLRG